jgi:hypothetical protein
VRNHHDKSDKRPVTLEELLVSSIAKTDALAKLLIEKGLISREELCRRFPRSVRRISKCYTKSNKVAQKDRVISVETIMSNFSSANPERRV